MVRGHTGDVVVVQVSIKDQWRTIKLEQAILQKIKIVEKLAGDPHFAFNRWR
jgi:hypothetical protein